jgi:hypothetical protein
MPKVTFLQVLHCMLELPISYFGWNIGYPVKVYLDFLILSMQISPEYLKLKQINPSASFPNRFSLRILFSLALQSSAGYGLLVSRGFLITHSDAPQSVELLWTSDQLVAQTST